MVNTSTVRISTSKPRLEISVSVWETTTVRMISPATIEPHQHDAGEFAPELCKQVGLAQCAPMAHHDAKGVKNTSQDDDHAEGFHRVGEKTDGGEVVFHVASFRYVIGARLKV
jgi:hypothetical protein